MRSDLILDEIRAIRDATYQRLGDSPQAWLADLAAQRAQLEQRGLVFTNPPMPRLSPQSAAARPPTD